MGFRKTRRRTKKRGGATTDKQKERAAEEEAQPQPRGLAARALGAAKGAFGAAKGALNFSTEPKDLEGKESLEHNTKLRKLDQVNVRFDHYLDIVEKNIPISSGDDAANNSIHFDLISEILGLVKKAYQKTREKRKKTHQL